MLNTTAVGKQNQTQKSDPENRVSKLTTTDEQNIVATIDNIGKSISSIKTNVSDSNLLSNNTLARDYTKTSINNNSSRSTTNNSSLVTNNLSDAKSTNESILRNIVNGVQDNTTASIPQNNTNPPIEYPLDSLKNNTQGETNSIETVSNETVMMNSTKSNYNQFQSPIQNIQANQTLLKSNMTVNDTLPYKMQQEYNSLPYNINKTSENNTNNVDNNKNNINSTMEIQQLNQTASSSYLTPPAPLQTTTMTTTTNETSSQTTIPLNNQNQTINSTQQGLVDVYPPPDSNTDMMQITSKNPTNEITSDINVPLIPTPLKINKTESNPLLTNYTNGSLLTNKTNVVLDTRLNQAQQVQSTVKENIEKNIIGVVDLMFNSNHSIEAFNMTKTNSEPFSPPLSNLSNSSIKPGEDLMRISEHPTVSFKQPTSSLYQAVPQRKSIIPTPDPRDRLAREYIPLYSNPSSSNSYSELDGDFLDGPAPKQFIGGNSVDKSETTSLKNFLEDERLEEQSITYEANSANTVRPHQVKVVDPIQRALNERKKQGKLLRLVVSTVVGFPQACSIIFHLLV